MSIFSHQKKKIITTIVAVFLFSILGTTAAEAVESPKKQTVVQDPTIQEELPNLGKSEKALYAIEEIPESVINQGTDAILDWFRNNIGDHVLVDEINAAAATKQAEQSDKQFQVKGVWGCISTAGLAIVTLAWTPAKLLKIKKALKAFGGVGTFVRKSISYYNYYKKKYRSTNTAWKKAVAKAAKKASPDVKKALLDFFGISAIVDACT
ncbi:hypothetical protein [Bacillus licheniformis]|uniref:hypothetical protein n=1 Tax=Bacillus licheniformis TaxID=1402 RepID=UPI0009D64FEF|nr:hypothetical protein [Bacillus licheniformis]